MKRVRFGIAVCLLPAVLVIGCDGEVSDESSLFPLGDSESGLRISQQEYRFGTREVGGSTVEIFTLANVGVDTYPINSITLRGRDAEDFVVSDNAITLEPGDTYTFEVSFRPQRPGQKEATLNLEYDTIPGIGSVASEAVFYNAKSLEQKGDLVAAADEYRRYINSDPATANREKAMARLPLLDEADVYGSNQGFELYREAMNLRDDENFDVAVKLLKRVSAEHGDGYLADDAMYMVGFIQLAELEQYDEGLLTMDKLIEQYPDTSYLDTALYSKGLAYAEMGRYQQAREILEQLRSRHSAMELGGYDFRWPKDTFVSRLWFEKSEKLLERL